MTGTVDGRLGGGEDGSRLAWAAVSNMGMISSSPKFACPAAVSIVASTLLLPFEAQPFFFKAK